MICRLGQAAGLLQAHHSAQMPARPSWQPIDMAAWASSNRLQHWVTAKLTLGTLPRHLFRYLKQKVRDTQSSGGKLPEAQRRELIAYLRGEETAPLQAAGRTAPPAPTRSLRAEIIRLEQELAAVKSASARTPPVQRGRSGGRGRDGRGRSGSRGRDGRGRSGSRRQTEAPAAPEGGYSTVVNRRRKKSKGQRPASAHSTAAPAPARTAPAQAESKPKPATGVVIEIVADEAASDKEKPVSTAWNCSYCKAGHRDDWKTHCRVCEKPKVDPVSAPSPATAESSRAEMEAKQKELMFLKESMVANKIPAQLREC